ncbi:MAG: DUF2147 domain-containing protein [Flavobacteriales bacterium]
MKSILFILTLFVSTMAFSQDIVGEWNNIDEETGEVNSVISIYKNGDAYFGKIIHITDESKRQNRCTKCTDDRKDKLIVGMEILKNLKKDGNRFSGGKILDPKTGKVYRAEIWVDENDSDKLNVRGYIAFFYDTREWRRKK